MNQNTHQTRMEGFALYVLHFYSEESPTMDAENGQSMDEERPQAPVFTPEQQQRIEQLVSSRLPASVSATTSTGSSESVSAGAPNAAVIPMLPPPDQATAPNPGNVGKHGGPKTLGGVCK